MKIDYRGYTMRKKRWAPDMERKIKDVLNIAKTPDEAVQYLRKQSLDDNDVALIMQRFYPNYSCNQLLGLGEQFGMASQRIPISSHEQQLELIGFSQNVSVCLFVHISYLQPQETLKKKHAILSSNRFTCLIRMCIRICDAIRAAYDSIVLKNYHHRINGHPDSHWFPHYSAAHPCKINSNRNQEHHRQHLWLSVRHHQLPTTIT